MPGTLYTQSDTQISQHEPKSNISKNKSDSKNKSKHSVEILGVRVSEYPNQAKNFCS